VCGSVILLLGHWLKQSAQCEQAFECKSDASPLIRFLECPDEYVADIARMVLTRYCSNIQFSESTSVPATDGRVQTLTSMVASHVYRSSEVLEMTSIAFCGVTRLRQDTANAFLEAGLVTHIAEALRDGRRHVDFERGVKCLSLLATGNIEVEQLYEASPDVFILLLDRLTEQREDTDPYFNKPCAFLTMQNMMRWHGLWKPSDKKAKEQWGRVYKELMEVIQNDGRLAMLLKVTAPP
jgi:hypothetical protein